ncbi:MAG: membrane protein insertion efficiency factor YidD [Candidatus Schekmanbacteria bacterium]|nr:MAG: membrane protein insertion efficiency factor YidD [Candidatus Schekmanbacteria bacterium]
MKALPISLIRLYQLTISPLFAPSCRFEPSCSNYAIEAYQKYGFFKATLVSLKRIIRCNPFGGSGYDPIE